MASAKQRMRRLRQRRLDGVLYLVSVAVCEEDVEALVDARQVPREPSRSEITEAVERLLADWVDAFVTGNGLPAIPPSRARH